MFSKSAFKTELDTVFNSEQARGKAKMGMEGDVKNWDNESMGSCFKVII